MFISPRVRRLQSVVVSAGFMFCCLVSAAAAQTYSLQLATDRGCQEFGGDPVYAVGEQITVSFRVNSATRSSAFVKLFDILNDGRVGVISFGQIATNQTRSFTARISPPLGNEQLLLQAETANGGDRARRSCTFRVVGNTPGPTATQTPTRTPRPATPTRTAANTRTATTTPGGPTPTPGALEAHVRTNRGCLETGDAARFDIGDPILVTFTVDSATLPFAQATLRDIFSNGIVKIFNFGTILTNARYILSAQVGGPTGFKTLQLRAQNGSSVSRDSCTFQVGGGFHVPTRTATRTHTPH